MNQTIDSVHVYPRGETRAGEPHVASMDCWCEPSTTLFVQAFDGDQAPLPVVVHSDNIVACKVLRPDAEESE